MTRQLHNRYPGPGGMFVLSLAIHLVVFLAIFESNLLPTPHQEEEQVTYVDIATLPVASPQSGTPAPSAKSAPEKSELVQPAPAPPPPLPAPRQAEMALPAPKPMKTQKQPRQAKSSKEATPAPAESTQEFSQRLAKLQQQAEEKRMSDVMARLGSKKGRTGMPGAKGSQAGSDYASYVKSRLRDALRERMNLQSKSPVVIATITIGSDGRMDYRLQKSSGDPLFDAAVAEAIGLAGKSLRPPPAGGQFTRTVTFKPDSVGVR